MPGNKAPTISVPMPNGVLPQLAIMQLKQHLHVQSSFPRSVQGYALHYLRVLLGYQLLMLGW